MRICTVVWMGYLDSALPQKGINKGRSRARFSQASCCRRRPSGDEAGVAFRVVEKDGAVVSRQSPVLGPLSASNPVDVGSSTTNRLGIIAVGTALVMEGRDGIPHSQHKG